MEVDDIATMVNEAFDLPRNIKVTGSFINTHLSFDECTKNVVDREEPKIFWSMEDITKLARECKTLHSVMK
jgi:hypothetical protein